MKICIDATPIGINTTDKGGVYRYIFELLEALSLIDRRNCYTLFFNFFRKKNYSAFQETIKRLKVGPNFHIRLSRFSPRLRQILKPPVELLSGTFDIYHGCFDSLPPIAFGKGVVCIHDVRYLEDFNEKINDAWVDILKERARPFDLYLKDYYARFHLFERLRNDIRRTAETASAIITVSEFSKARIVEKLNISPDKIYVVYNGLNSSFRNVHLTFDSSANKRSDPSKPYILFVGKFEPLKNLHNILQAFKLFSEKNSDYLLIFAGPVNWFYFIVLDAVEKLGLKEKVIFKGYVMDEELRALYKGASLFLMPSLYEGFGIPLIEAMTCGIPVVTSDIPPVKEIVRDAAVKVAPHDVKGIAEAMLQVLDDKRLASEMIAKGLKISGEFDWAKTAQQTLSVYEKVYAAGNKK